MFSLQNTTLITVLYDIITWWRPPQPGPGRSCWPSAKLPPLFQRTTQTSQAQRSPPSHMSCRPCSRLWPRDAGTRGRERKRYINSKPVQWVLTKETINTPLCMYWDSDEHFWNLSVLQHLDLIYVACEVTVQNVTFYLRVFSYISDLEMKALYRSTPPIWRFDKFHLVY